MSKNILHNLSSYLLAAFFTVGAYANFFPAAETAENYLRWGYPTWFHFVTGILELAVAVLIIPGKTRLVGSLLAAAIMFSAVATVVFHGEAAHATAPFVVLCASAVIAFSSVKMAKSKASKAVPTA